jgi:uncharacterized protein (DUF1800 family)
MKPFKFSWIASLTFLFGISLCSFLTESKPVKVLHFPYKRAGLTAHQAAAHLLSRFSYGATPGQVDSVVKMGLEKWFEQQLNATLPDDSLNRRLSVYDAIYLSNTDACNLYPQGSVVIAMALKDSVISKDSVDKAVNRKAYNQQIQAYMQQKGLKSDQDLYKQFINQNILRAVYTNNQLQEVLTDFWFNHFNVSFTKGESAHFIPSYERDVIRPNVLGKFDRLLLGSAKSPAMLYFLDNFISVGPQPPAKNKPAPVAAVSESIDMTGNIMTSSITAMTNTVVKKPNKNIAGLNENYAREVMELHTLGVDGGYTQQDVTEAARILTGWTIYPIAAAGPGSAMKNLVVKIGEENLEQKGFVHDGDFLFTPNRHDKGEKKVLGHTFPADGGYNEGIELLELLAHHTSTAKFICKKLAVRFVSDNPPQTLLNKMAKSFIEQDGSIREVLITMVNSPEFWDRKVLRQKIKSPFELAVSAARSLNADVQEPYQLYNWIARMGQKIYYYQAPTGFPDKAQYWINTGALLNRMNFSLSLAFQQIAGTKLNLPALTNYHEPESAVQALEIYSKLLMPDRKLTNVIKQLTPLLNDPALLSKVNNAATKAPEVTPEKPIAGPPGDMMTMGAGQNAEESKTGAVAKVQPKLSGNNTMLSQVVGIIIGSPEFQRR